MSKINLESVVADTDNLKMTPEIEQELNKIYEKKEGIYMKKSNKKISNITIERVINKYKNVKNSRLLTNKNSYGISQRATEILIGICDNFLDTKEIFRQYIVKFIGIACVNPDANIYGLDCDGSISIEEYYEECLLLWLYDLERHLLDLNVLVNYNKNINITTTMQCYLETKILCCKLRFALEQSTYDYESLSDSGEIDKYNIQYDTLRHLELIYNDICSCIEALGNYLFVYISKYETFTTNRGFIVTEMDELVDYFKAIKKEN